MSYELARFDPQLKKEITNTEYNQLPAKRKGKYRRMTDPLPTNAPMFYIGKRFKTSDGSKIGILKITFCSVFYVTKENVNNPVRVSIPMANRLVFEGIWKHYFGED